MKPFPNIETERLILREPRQEDLQRVYEIHSDAEVMRYYGVLPYDSVEEAKKHLDWLSSLYREDKGLRPVITLKDEDTYIGDVGFYDFESKHNRAEVGYILGKDYWGKGIMTEVAQEVIRFGFESMGLKPYL